jgi:acetylglutamate kinase
MTRNSFVPFTHIKNASAAPNLRAALTPTMSPITNTTENNSFNLSFNDMALNLASELEAKDRARSIISAVR